VESAEQCIIANCKVGPEPADLRQKLRESTSMQRAAKLAGGDRLKKTQSPSSLHVSAAVILSPQLADYRQFLADPVWRELLR